MVAPPLLWTQFVVACYDEVSLGQLSELGSRLGAEGEVHARLPPRLAFCRRLRSPSSSDQRAAKEVRDVIDRQRLAMRVTAEQNLISEKETPELRSRNPALCKCRRNVSSVVVSLSA